jgi:hypothetical protein
MEAKVELVLAAGQCLHVAGIPCELAGATAVKVSVLDEGRVRSVVQLEEGPAAAEENPEQPVKARRGK